MCDLSLSLHVIASKFSWNHFISERYKNNTVIEVKFASNLCKYTLLPATVKVLEKFLEAILWKPFQFFHRILNNVGSITKAPSLHC